MLYSSILGVIAQRFSWKRSGLLTCVEFSRSTRIFAPFAIEMIANETRPLLNSVGLSSNAINKSETWHMLRRDISAYLLKNSCETFYPVKCYGKTNMIFCIKYMGKIQVGLTSFGQFIGRLGLKLSR